MKSKWTVVALLVVSSAAYCRDKVKERFDVANALAEQNRWSDAIAEYREVLRLAPRFAEAHYNLANALQAKGDRAGAIAEYRAALSAAPPGDPDTHFNLANALEEDHDLDGAIEEYGLALI